jgi:site-specific DNA-methyltransferase (adenine-specific)
MVTNIEDAGFEIRDVITWLYSSGYPKGLDISKQIDRIELGIVRGERGVVISDNKSMSGSNFERTAKGEPISENAKLWDGWGTCLKPACEFITLVRKPIDEKNIALNVLKWGTGGINIDGSRIELSGEIIPINKLESWSGFGEIDKPDYQKTENNVGRWPANVILDEEAGSILDKQAGHTVSRYFYCAKPNHNEKALGLDSENKHPTQKPVKLLEYLVRLITPKGGVCIDPFMGSGSTGIACVNLDFNFIGIEKEPHYFEIAESRINYVKSQK